MALGTEPAKNTSKCRSGPGASITVLECIPCLRKTRLRRRCQWLSAATASCLHLRGHSKPECIPAENLWLRKKGETKERRSLESGGRCIKLPRRDFRDVAELCLRERRSGLNRCAHSWCQNLTSWLQRASRWTASSARLLRWEQLQINVNAELIVCNPSTHPATVCEDGWSHHDWAVSSSLKPRPETLLSWSAHDLELSVSHFETHKIPYLDVWAVGLHDKGLHVFLLWICTADNW